MNPPPRIAVVIPALNEAPSIPLVLADLPADLVAVAVVCDNGSTDGTPEVARGAGAVVVHEPERGYGAACLRGLSHLAADPPDIVVFLDADYSDHPDQLAEVVEPILKGRADVVIGSRTLGEREPGAMLPQAIFGNWLATTLIRLFWGHRYTDLGPFRAATWEALTRVRMADRNFGWTVELQIKALAHRLRVVEVPARYRRRKGVSKITGTVSGSVKAGAKILWFVFRYSLAGLRQRWDDRARRGPLGGA
ncbi:MAG: glycosyltransferase family 2 protein [Myxococcales bacterium]|nr:glycosyltransferase family 2 protein [Myxococcales bacterium]